MCQACCMDRHCRGILVQNLLRLRGRKDVVVGKHLVLVGGGHAHMLTLAGIRQFVEKNYNVTVVGPLPYHYYSGMGPGMLGKTYTPADIRFATKKVVEKQGGRFILDKVTRVDPEKKVLYFATAKTMSYDIVSFNTGSYVPWSEVTSGGGRDIFSVKPIERLIEAQARILALVFRKKITVSVVGGGPSAVEIAGNLWRLVRNHGKIMPKIQIFAGKQLLSKFPDKVRIMAVKSLSKRDVDILANGYVRDITPGKVTLASGRSYPSDVTFLAHGIKPSPIFRASGLPIGPDGDMVVNKYLQSTAYPEIFGGGDCIYFEDRPLDKVGVFAVRENPILFHNLMASLEGKELKSFNPGKGYLLILNMGDGTGIFRKKWIIFGGRAAFVLKDFIDRRFMKKFQFNEHL